MFKLIRIEDLRQILVKKIMEITGLPIDDFSVEISFTGTDENTLLVEASNLEWHKIQYGDAEWYTSERPAGGAVTVHMEEKDEPIL